MNDLGMKVTQTTSYTNHFQKSIDEKLNMGIIKGARINMEWLVEELNYPNRKKLERDFRRYLNTTYRNYIMQTRLTIASKMLCHECLSVKAVALSSGFSNSATFCNAFKKEFGSAPSEYRVDMYNEYLLHGCPYESQCPQSKH